MKFSQITLLCILPSIVFSSFAQASEIVSTLVKQEIRVTPIYQYMPCKEAQLESASKFQKERFGKVKFLVSNAELSLGCGASRGCLLQLYYNPSEGNEIEYYEQSLEGQCTLKNIENLPSFDVSTFQANIQIEKADLLKAGIAEENIKSTRIKDTQFGRVIATIGSSEFLRFSISYSQKPLFDIMDINGKEFRIQYASE